MVLYKYYYNLCVISTKGSWILLKLIKLCNKIATNMISLSIKWQFVIVQLGFPYTFLFKWLWLSTRRNKRKVKWSRYRTGVAQRVGTGIALLFLDHGTRREWVVSSTPRPHFTPGKDPVPILQEAGWAPGPVWTGGKSRLHRDSIPDLPACSQSLYWLTYPAHRPNN